VKTLSQLQRRHFVAPTVEFHIDKQTANWTMSIRETSPTRKELPLPFSMAKIIVLATGFVIYLWRISQQK
jgi:hypothetical protein